MIDPSIDTDMLPWPDRHCLSSHDVCHDAFGVDRVGVRDPYRYGESVDGAAKVDGNRSRES